MTELFGKAARRIAYSLPVLKLRRTVDAFVDNRFSERGMITQAFVFAHLNAIAGDYFEFGLWQGRTFLHAWRMKKLYGFKDMHLWGFDSFQGLPTVKPAEDEIWSTGQFSCSELKFRAILASQGVRKEEFTLVAGFYDQSLNDAQHAAMSGRKAAIVYIDCDLYESTVPVLSFIEPYLVDGTIVCFDDFYCYGGKRDQGEQQALREFLKARPDIEFQKYLTYCPVGQSFIVQRRSS